MTEEDKIALRSRVENYNPDIAFDMTDILLYGELEGCEMALISDGHGHWAIIDDSTSYVPDVDEFGYLEDDYYYSGKVMTGRWFDSPKDVLLNYAKAMGWIKN